MNVHGLPLDASSVSKIGKKQAKEIEQCISALPGQHCCTTNLGGGIANNALQTLADSSKWHIGKHKHLQVYWPCTLSPLVPVSPSLHPCH